MDDNDDCFFAAFAVDFDAEAASCVTAAGAGRAAEVTAPAAKVGFVSDAAVAAPDGVDVSLSSAADADAGAVARGDGSNPANSVTVAAAAAAVAAADFECPLFDVADATVEAVGDDNAAEAAAESADGPVVESADVAADAGAEEVDDSDTEIANARLK